MIFETNMIEILCYRREAILKNGIVLSFLIRKLDNSSIQGIRIIFEISMIIETFGWKFASFFHI